LKTRSLRPEDLAACRPEDLKLEELKTRKPQGINIHPNVWVNLNSD
jgi:hypothetical protein